MRGAWKLVVACAPVLLLLAGAGCGSGGEDASEDGAAAINGSGADQSRQQGGSNAAPTGPGSSAGPSLTMPGRKALKPVPPKVVIRTSMGPITVELDSQKVPGTVENFLRYVDAGFYNGTIFHQVFPGAVILGGMFTPPPGLAEKGGAGPPIFNEAHKGQKNVRGTIAMARQYSAPDSATCAFFINVENNPNYDYRPGVRDTYDNPEDYGYCVFGKVVDGMDVVDRIAGVKVHDIEGFERIPVETVLIESIQRVP